MNGIRHRVSLAAASLTIASLTACASQPTALPVHLVRTALAPAATSTPVVITPTASPSPTALPTLPLVPTLTLVPSATPIPSVFLVAGGDVMLARQIGDRLAAGEVDYPFALVAETLRSADIAAVNLECAISDRGESLPKKAYRFRAPPSAAASLALAGIDVVTLANNHAMDYGPEGLADTLRLLDTVG
ncbi:MAG: CapA family protein, partial [Chloroflexi bacterium]|nr:CapA family protein [Chloroflexota bacterium]